MLNIDADTFTHICKQNQLNYDYHQQPRNYYNILLWQCADPKK